MDADPAADNPAPSPLVGASKAPAALDALLPLLGYAHAFRQSISAIRHCDLFPPLLRQARYRLTQLFSHALRPGETLRFAALLFADVFRVEVG